MNESDSSRTARNMMDQLYPGRIDADKTVTDNFYDLVGYKNPAQSTEDKYASLLDGPLFPEEQSVEESPYQRMIDSNARKYINDSRAKEYTMGDKLSAFGKGLYASEGFADNIGTILHTNGAYWALNNGKDWLAERLATDWQFGIEMPSMRGGTWGLYGDIKTPEEMMGPDWKSLNPVQMRERLARYKAKQVEQYWQGTDDLPLWEGVGDFAGQIFDVSNIAPTGYVGLAAKFTGLAGKTAGKIGAGATVGLGWGVADAALDMYVRENEIDLSRLMSSALVGTAVGAALPVVGDLYSAMFRKHRQSGTQTKPEDLQRIKDDYVAFEQEKLKKLEGEPKSDDLEIAQRQEALLGTQKQRVDTALKADPEEVANLMNAATRNGDATDNARLIDDAIRWNVGRQKEDMDYSQLSDKMNRTPVEDIRKVLDSDEFAKMEDYEQDMVRTYIAVRSGEKPPKVKAFDAQRAEKALSDRDIQNRTQTYMDIIKNHGQEYKYDLARHLTTTAGASASAGGVSLALTGDEDFALMMALSVGGVALGAPGVGKMYGMTMGDIQVRLNSPDPKVRTGAIQDLKASRIKSILAGTHGITVNDWVSVPIRQWYARGGVAKTLARDLELTGENIKLGINDRLVKYAQIMSNHNNVIGANIPTSETPIVARLMTKQLNAKSPGVRPEHVKAAAEMRKLYNAEVRAGQKAGIISKSEADKMLKDAEAEGYLNRVYFTDYLQTKKGADHFAQRLADVNRKRGKEGMTSAETRQLIETITGMTQKESLEALTNIRGKGGQYLLSGSDIRALMRKSTGVAQTSKFLERGRKLPTHLEEALDPFLVRDLKTAFIKYVESTQSRIEHAKTFGPNNERASAYRRKISDEWGSERLGKLAEQDILGAQFDPQNDYLKQYFNMSSAFKNANNLVQHYQNSKLVASAPLNFTQHVVYLPTKMAKWGMGSGKIIQNMGKAYRESALEILGEAKRRGADGKEFVNRYGTMIDTITYSATGDIMRQQPHGTKLGGKFGLVHSPDIWLRASGFHGAEKWNRRVAGHVGKFIVDDTIARKAVLERKVRPSKAEAEELAQLKRTMTSLGLDPNTPIQSMSVREMDDAGYYAAEKLLRDPNLESSHLAASQRMSNITNFQSDYLNKPRKWHGPMGQWFGKFRTFMLHANAFARDNIIKPLVSGDAKPLATMLVIGGFSGATVAEIKDLIRNDDYEYSNLETVLGSWLAVGGLGMGGELASQVVSHPTKLLSFLAGPVYTDMYKLGEPIAPAAAEFAQDPDWDHVVKLSEDILGTLASGFGPAKYGAGIASYAGFEDPFPNKADYQRDERRRGAGFEPLTGL